MPENTNSSSPILPSPTANTTTHKNGSTVTGTPGTRTNSSPPAPQAILSSSADLSPGIPNTAPPIQQQLELSSPSKTQRDAEDSEQRTPRARQTSSTTRLVPPDYQRSSRPSSQTSFVSTSSRGGRQSLSSPLCTPKVRDFAYPRNHKYHAPPFSNRRYSVSSRSSTSSDIDALFPAKIGGGPLYISEEMWKDVSLQGEDDVDAEFDEEGEQHDDEEVVERRAVCVFDFIAECEGEVSVQTGQVVWVEFRKGVSGWLVVRDEITGTSDVNDVNGLESKGLVPEGYVRFLTEEEERQYLSQSPPSNLLFPRDPVLQEFSTGEETPRQIEQSQTKHAQWDVVRRDDDDDSGWVDLPENENEKGKWDVDRVNSGVERMWGER